jgi:hypothetical protein
VCSQRTQMNKRDAFVMRELCTPTRQTEDASILVRSGGAREARVAEVGAIYPTQLSCVLIISCN